MDDRLYDMKYWRIGMVFTRCCWREILPINNQETLDEIKSEQDDCGGIEVYRDMAAVYSFYYQNAARLFQFKDMDDIHKLLQMHMRKDVFYNCSPMEYEFTHPKKIEGINLSEIL